MQRLFLTILQPCGMRCYMEEDEDLNVFFQSVTQGLGAPG